MLSKTGVNNDCPDFYICKLACGAQTNPYCEADCKKCTTHIKMHKEKFPELYKLICQT